MKMTLDSFLTSSGTHKMKSIIHLLPVNQQAVLETFVMLDTMAKNDVGIFRYGEWYIKLPEFARFAQNNWPLSPMPMDWDPNRIIAEKGVFYLSEITDPERARIPIARHAIVAKAQEFTNPRETIGVWKDEHLRRYLVDLSVFGPVIKQLWLGDA